MVACRSGIVAPWVQAGEARWSVLVSAAASSGALRMLSVVPARLRRRSRPSGYRRIASRDSGGERVKVREGPAGADELMKSSRGVQRGDVNEVVRTDWGTGAQAQYGDAQEEPAESLKAAMTGRGRGQAEFAKATEVSPATVSNVLTSKVVPSQAALEGLLHALGITGERREGMCALRQGRTRAPSAWTTISPPPRAPSAITPTRGSCPATCRRWRPCTTGSWSVGKSPAAAVRPERRPRRGCGRPVSGSRRPTPAWWWPVRRGESSLRRTYLADTGADWRAGKAGPVLAVLVPASALLGAPLAEALAKYCRTRVQPSPPYQETTTAGSGHEPLLEYQDPVGAPGRLGPAGAPSPAPRPFPGTSPVSQGTGERHSDSSSRKR
ncbi:hypothetical protein ADL04_27715 [Streptomyces sp. NRRL B-3648]|nr:hypothetical protein ADL04_27715 [Streptomyces sp. NRRL B-3648]